jgi:phage-related protein
MSVQIVTSTGTVTVTGDGVASWVGAVPTFIGTLPVLAPPKNPDQAPDISFQANLLVAGFGDGYTQASPKGINHIGSTLGLSWSLLLKTESDPLEAFFTERGGYQAFWYALPNRPLLQWRAPSWKVAGRGPVYWSFAASMQRSFDPVT